MNVGAAYGLTNEDIAAYVEENGDRAQMRRVAAAALVDPSVRERVLLLRAVEAAPENDAPLDTARRDRLRASMLESARTIHAAANADDVLRRLAEVARGGGLWRVAAQTWEALTCALADRSRTLATGVHTLSLPCLAPAAAASGDDLTLRRETITSSDGVRIEFQQLPGEKSRLRVLVDASAAASGETDSDDADPYNVAFVTLEEAAGDNPARHILVVALNEAGRGFTDFTLGRGAAASAESAGSVLPSPRGVCQFVSATLTRLPPP